MAFNDWANKETKQNPKYKETDCVNPCSRL